MIDFSLTDELPEYQDRTRAFIRDKIIPMEDDTRPVSYTHLTLPTIYSV